MLTAKAQAEKEKVFLTQVLGTSPYLVDYQMKETDFDLHACCVSNILRISKDDAVERLTDIMNEFGLSILYGQ